MKFRKLHFITREYGEVMAKKPVASKKPRKKQSVMDPNEQNSEPKGPGKLQKLFFWVIIPVLFALAVGLIVAEVTGTNVFEKAKTLVGKNSDQTEQTTEQSIEDYNKEIVKLQAQVKEKEALVTKLQSQIDANKTDTSKLEVEKKRLEKEVKKLQDGKADNKTDSTLLTKTYEQMAPKSAAAAISAMKNEEALSILNNLKPATLAPILEKMTPEKAAYYTEAMSKGEK